MGRWLAWFVPQSARDAGRTSTRQATLVAAACFIIGPISVLTALIQMVDGTREVLVSTAALAGAACAIPWWMRSGASWRTAGTALCAAAWLAACVVTVVTGGSVVAGAYYMIFAATLAAALIGWRPALGFSLASLFAILGVYTARALGVEFPHEVEHAVGVRSALRGAVGFNISLACLVVAYEWLRGDSLQAAEASERRFLALAEHGSDLIAEVDEEGRTIFASSNHRMLGLRSPPGAVDGLDREGRRMVGRGLAALAHQPSVRVGPLRWEDPDQPPRWFEVALTRFTTAAGEQHMLSVARDVSERIQLEVQLRQSQKMEAIGQLAGGAAHDLNNLLLVISGYAELLERRGEPGSEAHAAIHEIQHAAEQASDVTRRLLALSRPSAIARRPIDVNTVVTGIGRLLRRMLGDTKLLFLALGSELPAVNADPGELEQVLVNLALNARDAMGEGGRLSIQTHALAGRVRIVVEDDGAGMDEATRARAFEPFFTTKAAGAGSGLGLYVVHTIVSELGGRVAVESEPGAGTRVSVELPAVEAAALRDRAASRRPSRGGHERVLLVEDRPEARELMRSVLAEAGYEVIVAADGVEALSLAERTQPFELLVTDVVMPRLGGRELARALHARQPGLRILFVSGHPHDLGDLTQIAPGARLLRKPFALDALLLAAREALDAR